MSVTQDYKILTLRAAKELGLCVLCALMIAAGPILQAVGLIRG